MKTNNRIGILGKSNNLSQTADDFKIKNGRKEQDPLRPVLK